jgi:LysM repeat protein
VLAPLALVASFVALVFVVIASTTGNDLRPPSRSHSSSGTRSVRTTGAGRSTYTVRAGDNLSQIAESTGVSVGQLTTLNPALDPQALISGECVNLRTKDDC